MLRFCRRHCCCLRRYNRDKVQCVCGRSVCCDWCTASYRNALLYCCLWWLMHCIFQGQGLRICKTSTAAYCCLLILVCCKPVVKGSSIVQVLQKLLKFAVTSVSTAKRALQPSMESALYAAIGQESCLTRCAGGISMAWRVWPTARSTCSLTGCVMVRVALAC